MVFVGIQAILKTLSSRLSVSSRCPLLTFCRSLLPTTIFSSHGCKSFKGVGYATPSFSLFVLQRLTMFIPGVCDLAVNAGKIFGNKEMRLLMLGLDAAGKTSKCLAQRTVFSHDAESAFLLTLFSHSV